MKAPKINQISPKEAFGTKEELRRWIFENREQLADVVNSNLSNNLDDYRQGIDEVRPDLYFFNDKLSDRIAVMTSLDDVNDEDFKKLLAIAAVRDLQKLVWVVTSIDKKTLHILYWLNEKIGFELEIIVLKIKVYDVEGFGHIQHLSILDNPKFKDIYTLS